MCSLYKVIRTEHEEFFPPWQSFWNTKYISQMSRFWNLLHTLQDTPQEPRNCFFYFLKWQKQFSQSISYWMRISSANRLHLGPPSTACAVLHPYILLATDAFPLWTAFRHPLISSPPQTAVFQTYLYLISQCTGRQHFWLFALITNTAFLTSHTTILRHRMWKKFSSAEELNSQVRCTRKKMSSFCSCNL